MQGHRLTVNYYPLKQWFTRETVLHTPHDLKLILVDHADVGDGGPRKRIVFVVVLLNKSTTNVREMEFVVVKQDHFRFQFQGLNIHVHHLRESFGSFNSLLVEGHKVVNGGVSRHLQDAAVLVYEFNLTRC